MKIGDGGGMTVMRMMQQAGQARNLNLEHIATGRKINRAAEGAAGMAISEKMQALLGGMSAQIENAEGTISMNQTADGGLDATSTQLNRLRELTVQAGNGTMTDGDRAHLQAEADQIVQELDRVAETTEYNTQPVIQDMGAAALGVADFNVGGGDQAVAAVDQAMDQVSTRRADLGAEINGARNEIATTQVARENLTAAESQIRDAAVAQEIIDLTKNNLMEQMGTKVLNLSRMNMGSVMKLMG